MGLSELNNRLYIVGFMGVGKSTVGRKLARKLGYEFFDTDRLLEKKYKIGIDSFFSKYGEELFRKLEHQCLEETFALNNCVISTGGGLPCHFQAMDKINQYGVSIFLKMSEKAIFNRLVNSKQRRPLVMNLNDEELQLEISKRLKSRMPFYQQANIETPGINIDIDKLVTEIRNF